MKIGTAVYTFRPTPNGWAILRDGEQVGEVVGRMSDARCEAKRIERTYDQPQPRYERTSE